MAMLILLAGANAASAASLQVRVMDESGAPVADAAVIAVSAAPVAMPPGKPAQVEQIDAEFAPALRVVQVGAAVSFPNRDNVAHHVYSFSPAKVFELPLYRGVPFKPVVFDKPGAVVLGCNIHDWMRGYIYVSESPYFAVSEADGHAVIANLPAGSYTVKVWHPRLASADEAVEPDVEVGAAGRELALQVKLKADVRLRRAPVGGAHGYP